MEIDSKSNFDLHRHFQTGKLNKITDVPGVKVGHTTLNFDDINTGVTAIIPASGNLFKEKVIAGCKVLNGFGKTTGLVQVKELGTLETPILMTNTFSVGTCYQALVKYMLKDNEDIGVTTGTVNPLVMECNDGDLNNIQKMAISEEDATLALERAEKGDPNFTEGAVGAGRGMRCLGFKGGIGSASRTVKVGEDEYHVGALVNSNFGSFGALRIGDRFLGEEIKDAVLQRAVSENNELYTRFLDKKDKGSIVMVIATDAPLSSRQLSRMCARSSMGLARTGSYSGDGSGDIALAFSTANRIDHYAESSYSIRVMPDSKMDVFFEATVEVIEESVISSLLHAKTITGLKNHTVYGLSDFL